MKDMNQYPHGGMYDHIRQLYARNDELEAENAILKFLIDMTKINKLKNDTEVEQYIDDDLRLVMDRYEQLDRILHKIHKEQEFKL